MANPCKYTLKDGKVLDFTQARQYVMDNIEELTKESPILKAKYDAAIKGKVEEGNQQEYKEGDKGRKAPKTSRSNRAKAIEAIPEEIRTPDVVAAFNLFSQAEENLPFGAKPMTSEEKSRMMAAQMRSESMKAAKEKAEAAAKKLNKLADDIANQTYATLPLLPQAVAAALKAAAKLLQSDAGVTLVEMVDAAIKALREFTDYAGLTDAQKQQEEEYVEREATEFFNQYQKTKTGSGNYKVSETAEKFIKGLTDRGLKSLAAIVEQGKYYEVRNQDQVYADAIALMAIDADASYELAQKGDLHPDIINAIFAQRLIDSMTSFGEDQNVHTQDAFEQANKDYQNYGTYVAQGLSMRGFLAKLIPSMMVIGVVNNISKALDARLKSDGKKKATAVAEEAKKIRASVFEKIARVISGENVDVKDLSNRKIKKALDILLSFGANLSNNRASETALDRLLKLIKEDGSFALNETREEVRELVATNLRGINQSLYPSARMTEAQVDKAIDAFMDTYEEIATYQMKGALDRAFGDMKDKVISISGSKNPTIAKQILYGALQGDKYISKFAAKYGLPTLTAENIAQLTTLAQNIAASRTRGAFAVANAANAFNNYVNMIKAKASGNFFKRNTKFFNYAAAYQFNNLLFRASILSKALVSNIFQTLPKMVMQMAREGSIKMGGTFNTLKTSVEDPVTKLKVEFNVSPTKDNMQFGYIGTSREGRSDIEADILKKEGKYFGVIPKQRFHKIFHVASSRAFAVIDALTIPLATAVTSRQAYGALLKSIYAEKNINKSREAIYKDVTSLLGRDETIVQAAFAKAMDEMRNGALWKELGFTDTDPFPQEPTRKNINSKEARVFLETKIRMYEILADGVTERLIQLNQNLNPALSTNDALMISEEHQKEINRYVAANTREISFLGRPPGTPGQLADVLNGLSKQAPILKHSTLMPLFNNAVANGFALYVKFDPLLSTSRSAKYKKTGKRGLTPKEQKRSYQQEFMLNMDQARLREAMFAGYAIVAGTVVMLKALRGDDDDDEKREDDAAKGKGTFIATKEMEGRGLRDSSGDPIKGGFIYINGERTYNWGISPFYGAFSAAAVLDNYRIFETATARFTDGVRRPFVEDDDRLRSAIGMYLMNTLSGVMNYSSMTQQYKTLSDLMQLTQEQDKRAGKRTKEAFGNVFANAIQSFVPLSGLQKDAQNAYDAYNGNPEKLAIDFYEKVAINLGFVDGALRSDKHDCFGRPVEEELKAVGPGLGFDAIQFDKGKLSLPFDRIYEDDPYMQMHTMHNYYPVVQNSTTIPDVIGIETEKEDDKLLDSLKEPAMVQGAPRQYTKSVDRSNLESRLKELKATDRIDEESVGTTGLNPEYPEYITYNLELTNEENQDANVLMGKLVKEVFDYVIDEDGSKKIAFSEFDRKNVSNTFSVKEKITNMDQMMLFNNNEQYKQSMTSLYSICKKIAIIRQVPDVQSQKLYVQSTLNSIYNWDADNLILEFPENIKDELTDVLDVIDDYEDYQDSAGKKSYANWLTAGKPKNDKAKKK